MSHALWNTEFSFTSLEWRQSGYWVFRKIPWVKCCNGLRPMVELLLWHGTHFTYEVLLLQINRLTRWENIVTCTWLTTRIRMISMMLTPTFLLQGGTMRWLVIGDLPSLPHRVRPITNPSRYWSKSNANMLQNNHCFLSLSIFPQNLLLRVTKPSILTVISALTRFAHLLHLQRPRQA